jgi:formate hydrogenlyase subunit 4
MKYMLLFLFACVVLGLWGPTKKQFTAIVAVLAVLLVVFFYLQPAKM